ncbi:MAG: hypothetical protein O3C40_24295 [Planctomycetota bacterium]|nr:hypothetical protein [Planctomycetota bacterium]
MTTIAIQLDEKLQHGDVETAREVTRLVAQIIELADHDSLDLMRSRAVEQEVLDTIDGGQAEAR